MSYCFYEQSNNRYEGHYLHRKYINFFLLNNRDACSRERHYLLWCIHKLIILLYVCT